MFFNFSALHTEEEKSKLSQLFEEYADLMIYVAKSIVKDHALAEDVTQDSFEKIIHNLDKIDEIVCHKTKGYIVTIVTHTAYDFLKKKSRTDISVDIDDEPIVDSEQLPLGKIVSAESYKVLVSTMDTLPDNLRSVALLYFAQEYDYAYIAETLNISYDTARQRLSRARKILKNKLLKGK